MQAILNPFRPISNIPPHPKPISLNHTLFTPLAIPICSFRPHVNQILPNFNPLLPPSNLLPMYFYYIRPVPTRLNPIQNHPTYVVHPYIRHTARKRGICVPHHHTSYSVIRSIFLKSCMAPIIVQRHYLAPTTI